MLLRRSNDRGVRHGLEFAVVHGGDGGATAERAAGRRRVCIA